MELRRLKGRAVDICYRVIHPVRRVYWRIMRPTRRGAKVIVRKEGRVALVRLGYGHKSWTLPGGGVGRKESFAEGARRELEEETGVMLSTSDLKFLTEYHYEEDGKHGIVQVFGGDTDQNQGEPDGFEIQEIGWFDPANLPDPCTPSTTNLIRTYA